MDWKAELLKGVLPLVLSALGIVGTYLLAKLATWVDAKGKEAKLAKALAALPHLAEAIWADVYATMKVDIEKAGADGVVTAEEMDDLKEEALAALKDSLSKHGFDALKEAFGPALDLVLGRVVERASQVAAAHAPASPK